VLSPAIFAPQGPSNEIHEFCEYDGAGECLIVLVSPAPSHQASRERNRVFARFGGALV
jgi:hypothetical protein